jgi:hypothetical protein
MEFWHQKDIEKLSSNSALVTIVDKFEKCKLLYLVENIQINLIQERKK